MPNKLNVNVGSEKEYGKIGKKGVIVISTKGDSLLPPDSKNVLLPSYEVEEDKSTDTEQLPNKEITPEVEKTLNNRLKEEKEFHSKENEGSTFFFTLNMPNGKVGDTIVEDNQTDSNATEKPTNLKILLVDDIALW